MPPNSLLKRHRLAAQRLLAKLLLIRRHCLLFVTLLEKSFKRKMTTCGRKLNEQFHPFKPLLTKKLGEHKEGLNNLDKWLEVMETCYADLSNQYKKSLLKTDDLENLGRRCNLRTLGVPEVVEQGNPTKFVADLLHVVLGPGGLEQGPVPDRAHRAADSMPAEGGLLRLFIVCIHYYQEKEQIQALARQKGRLEFQGKQIFIFPNYSANLARHRAAFNEVKGLLRKKDGVRYGLPYPARFRTSFNGETQVFDSPKAVKNFIDSKFESSPE